MNQTSSPATQKSEDIGYRLIFPSSGGIRGLTSDDFQLTDGELLKLKSPECTLILFYSENQESYQLANIWALVAQQTAGPIFGAVNILNERRIAAVLTKLKTDGSNPLHWAGLKQYPFILVYRNGWPVAIYNGPREVQSLIDYSLTLACNAGYFETLQIGGSMEADKRLEMGPYQPYIDLPNEPPRTRKISTEYTSTSPIRGFNQKIPEVIPGTAAAAAATSQVRAEETRLQSEEAAGISGSLTETQEAPPSASTPSPAPIAVPA